MEENFLKNSVKLFTYYKSLGDKSFAQLEEDKLFWQYNPESNSIAIIVNHLWGNMMSRWTDFLHADGEKSWRKRDMEFEDIIKSKAELLAKWEEGWACLFAALESVNADNFGQKIYIRNQAHTILEAIDRQLAHYASHIGQIVYIGRMIRGSEWKSLSIPKGKSQEFNQKKFVQKDESGHFTDDFVEAK
ncbi:MAG: DUF1572 family protein [Bacteroidota bacterium]